MEVIGQIVEYLFARGRLTFQDFRYLANEGFCDELGEETEEYNGVDFDLWNQELPEPWDDLEDLEKYKALKRKKRAQPLSPKGAKAVDIRDRIVERRPSWEPTLAPIVSLAQQMKSSATLETAPILLRDIDPKLLLQAMVAEIKAKPLWFEALWDALKFEEYRQCGGSGSIADNAYRAVLTGRSLSEITKYAWIMRHPEIAWVYTLITVQHQLMRVCGVLFDTQFPLIDSYLAHAYRSKALWPYILLYSAHRYASGKPMVLLGQECWLPADTLPEPPLFASAWESALEMKRIEVLPFMVHATGAQEPVRVIHQASKQPDGLPLLCSSRWYKPY